MRKPIFWWFSLQKTGLRETYNSLESHALLRQENVFLVSLLSNSGISLPNLCSFQITFSAVDLIRDVSSGVTE